MLSIDRIEENIAVCIDDDGNICNIDLSLIEGGPAEGDIIYPDGERYKISADETQRRREEIEELQDQLFE